MEQPNKWKPVTDEYQQAKDPLLVSQAPGAQIILEDVKRRYRDPDDVSVPFSVTAITWYYFLRGVAYVLFAAVLISRPMSSFAGWLTDHSRLLIPFFGVQGKNEIFGNLFAFALVASSIVSVVFGVLWMLHFRHIRWITLCLTGGTLIRNGLELLTNRVVGSIHLTPSEQKTQLIVGSIIDLMIFCYLAISRGVARILQTRA